MKGYTLILSLHLTAWHLIPAFNRWSYGWDARWLCFELNFARPWTVEASTNRDESRLAVRQPVRQEGREL